MNTDSNPEHRRGVLLALLCYGIWGLFPLFWHPLKAGAVPAAQVLAHRIVWSLLLTLALTYGFGQGRELKDSLGRRRLLWSLLLSSLLIAANWLIYLWAILNQRVLEASLGYYINPLVNVLLGFIFLGERLHGRQWLALALALAGIVWLGLGLGQMPWISLGLAFTFAFYALVRKLTPLGALTGLTLETLYLFPLAAAYLLWCQSQGQLVFATLNGLQQGLLLSAGLVTVVPLLAFVGAARRIPLSLLGMLQYFAPTIQLFLGLMFGESLDLRRLLGYGLVWLGVVIYLLPAKTKV